MSHGSTVWVHGFASGLTTGPAAGLVVAWLYNLLFNLPRSQDHRGN